MTQPTRYLDAHDAFEVAGGILGVSAFAAYRSCRHDLLISALERSSVTSAGKHLYPSIPEKAAILVAEIVARRVFAQRCRSIAVAIAVVFAARNGLQLARRAFEPRVREQLRHALVDAEHRRPGAATAIRDWLEAQLEPGPLPTSAAPIQRHVFVASPVSGLSRRDMAALERFVAAARATITSAPRLLGLDYRLSPFPPGPHDTNGGPTSIYSRDRDTLLGFCSASICIEHHRSGGVALVLEMATRAGIPTLHLYPDPNGAGDMTGGVQGRIRRDHYDDDPSNVAIAVYRFLATEHDAIRDADRRRLHNVLNELESWATIRCRWEQLSDSQRALALHTARMEVETALELLNHHTLFANAPTHWISSLRAALNAPIVPAQRNRSSPPTTSGPRLPPGQRRQLGAAVKRLNWPASAAERVEDWLLATTGSSSSFRSTDDNGWDEICRQYRDRTP